MKSKVIIKVIEIFLIVFLILTSGLMFYSLILFKSLEKFYMIMALVIIVYITTIISYSLNKGFRNKNMKKFLITCVVSVIFSVIFGVAGYLIFNIYSKIDNFNKSYITYSTSLITFDSNIEDIKDIKNLEIGIVKNEEDMELYVLPNEVIDKYTLEKNNKIEKYNSVIDLIDALYNGDVDAIFINGNYKDIFNVLDEYSNIENKAVDVFNYSKKIEKTDVESSISTSNAKTLTEPFTILLIGVDSEEDGLDKNAAFNGDTIMLITFNPETLNATMFSIPRDTYVKVSCGNGQLQKINTSAYGGTSCVIKTVENMTGIDIDYYAKINFTGVINLVDALGGITVDVPYKFCEQNSKRQWGENIIYLESGVQKLNGEEALALARNRKTHDVCADEWNEDGIRNDFVRGQNQQLVVAAMFDKIKTIKSANTLINILDITSKNTDTNLTTEQMLSFYDVVKTIISAKSIDIVNIQKTLLTGYDVNLYEQNAGIRYAFFNWSGSLKAIVNLMKENLKSTNKTTVKDFSFSINNSYEQAIIGKGSYNETKVSLVPNFYYYTISEAIEWGTKNSIQINIIEKETNENISSNYSDYELLSQSVHEKVLVSKSGKKIDLYYKLKTSASEVSTQE